MKCVVFQLYAVYFAVKFMCTLLVNLTVILCHFYNSVPSLMGPRMNLFLNLLAQRSVSSCSEHYEP